MVVYGYIHYGSRFIYIHYILVLRCMVYEWLSYHFLTLSCTCRSFDWKFNTFFFFIINRYIIERTILFVCVWRRTVNYETVIYIYIHIIISIYLWITHIPTKLHWLNNYGIKKIYNNRDTNKWLQWLKNKK